MSARPHFLEPLLEAGVKRYNLVNILTGSVVANHLELAADPKTRNRGLLGRSELAAGSAMIIAPCNAVHTFFMQFTIDVVFVDRQGAVLKLCPHLKPWRIGAVLGGFAAIELTAGAIAGSKIVRGDTLKLLENA
jgi:uncharacterized membrane protein (UPF0127 family)